MHVPRHPHRPAEGPGLDGEHVPAGPRRHRVASTSCSSSSPASSTRDARSRRCRPRAQSSSATSPSATTASRCCQDLNLQIPAGKTVAIVGATGAGKTTLVNLLVRLYDPWEGQVLIDGVDVRQMTLARPARDRGLRAPGDLPVLRISARERGAVARRRASSTRSTTPITTSQAGQRPRPAHLRPRYGAGRARRHALGRPEAARRAGACPPQGLARRRPRRRPVARRHAHRGRDPRRPARTW